MKKIQSRKIIFVFAFFSLIALTIIGIKVYSHIKEPYDPIKAYSSIEKSFEGISNYVETVRTNNKKLAEIELKGLIISVAFAEKLSIEEVWRLAEEYDIDIINLQGYGTNYYETTITSFFMDISNDIENAKAFISKHEQDYEFNCTGIIGMNAMITSKNINELQNEKSVFLIDTSGDGYFTGDRSVNGFERNNLSRSSIEIFPMLLTDEIVRYNIIEPY